MREQALLWTALALTAWVATYIIFPPARAALVDCYTTPRYIGPSPSPEPVFHIEILEKAKE